MTPLPGLYAAPSHLVCMITGYRDCLYAAPSHLVCITERLLSRDATRALDAWPHWGKGCFSAVGANQVTRAAYQGCASIAAKGSMVLPKRDVGAAVYDPPPEGVGACLRGAAPSTCQPCLACPSTDVTITIIAIIAIIAIIIIIIIITIIIITTTTITITIITIIFFPGWQGWARVSEAQRALGLRDEARDSMVRALRYEPNNQVWQAALALSGPAIRVKGSLPSPPAA
jgi:hypothetical protein